MLDHVRFRDEDHSYTNGKGEVYTSATQLISKFKPPYDAPYWSLYKAIEEIVLDRRGEDFWKGYKKEVIFRVPKQVDELQKILYRDFIPATVKIILDIQQRFLNDWDLNKQEACNKGTLFHLEREKEAYELGVQVYPGTDITGTVQGVYSFDLWNLPDGYYTELLVYNHLYKIAGQIDRVWITTIPDQYHLNPLTGEVIPLRYIDLDDWKTNKEIKTSNRFQKMLSPIGHLDDCNFNHYQLQINLYSWILEQWGYVTRHRRFTHCKEEERIPYLVSDLRPEIENMLLHHSWAS